MYKAPQGGLEHALCMASMENSMIERYGFEAGLKAACVELAASEKITRATLSTWANKVLEAVHEFGNPAYMDNVLAVLSPANRATAKIYFTRFSGYSYNEAEGMYGKKSAKRAAPAREAWVAWSASGGTIWSYHKEHIKQVETPYTDTDVQKGVARLWNLGHKANMSNAQFLKNIMLAKTGKDGAMIFTMDDLVSALQDLDIVGELDIGQESPMYHAQAPATAEPATI